MSGPQKNQTPATRPKCACGSRKPARLPVCRACWNTTTDQIRVGVKRGNADAYNLLIDHAKARATL